MGFVGDDGEFAGFDLELAAEVAQRLGLELVLQPLPGMLRIWNYRQKY